MGEQSYRQIPNLLKKYRRIRGLDQGRVAQLLGMKNSSRISRWENGDCIPSAMNLFRLAAIYRVLVDALFIEHLRAIRRDLIAKENNLVVSNRRGREPRATVIKYDPTK